MSEQMVVNGQREFSAEDVNTLKDTIAKGLDDSELALFTRICTRTGLDPFARQIYAMRRWDGKLGREVMSVQTSIDGFRLIAERSGDYAGQSGPWWCGDNGVWVDVWLKAEPPAAAKVGVLRQSFAEPLMAVALWSEYAQKGKEGRLTGLWGKMPTTMLAKCAESLALRKAFPNELSGLYTREEMSQAEVLDDAPATAPAPIPPRRGRPTKAESEARRQAQLDEMYGRGPETTGAKDGAPAPDVNELLASSWEDAPAPPSKPQPKDYWRKRVHAYMGEIGFRMGMDSEAVMERRRVYTRALDRAVVTDEQSRAITEDEWRKIGKYLKDTNTPPAA